MVRSSSNINLSLCLLLLVFQESGEYSASDSQMALELSSMVLTSEEACQQTKQRAKVVRVAALKARAAEQTSANGRNYYLTQVNHYEWDLLKIQQCIALKDP